jgi:hypothetical protein
MDINLPIFKALILAIADEPNGRKPYPTSSLKKGLVMIYQGQDLAEEAVGFGVPVIKQGLQTIFPGNIELDFLHRGSTWVVTATYTINLIEKIARLGTERFTNKCIYTIKNFLAAFIRQFPPTRGFLTSLSNRLRRLFGWETTYGKAAFSTQVKMIYYFTEGSRVLAIEADLTGIPQDKVTETVIMNEQGAHTFDQYNDSSGITLLGKEIGCWDEVTAEEASFASSTHHIAFSLPRVAGAHLFRGRELIGSRLAWAGFGYSFPPSIRRFRYTVRFEKLP